MDRDPSGLKLAIGIKCLGPDVDFLLLQFRKDPVNAFRQFIGVIEHRFNLIPHSPLQPVSPDIG